MWYVERCPAEPPCSSAAWGRTKRCESWTNSSDTRDKLLAHLRNSSFHKDMNDDDRIDLVDSTAVLSYDPTEEELASWEAWRREQEAEGIVEGGEGIRTPRRSRSPPQPAEARQPSHRRRSGRDRSPSRRPTAREAAPPLASSRSEEPRRRSPSARRRTPPRRSRSRRRPSGAPPPIRAVEDRRRSGSPGRSRSSRGTHSVCEIAVARPSSRLENEDTICISRAKLQTVLDHVDRCLAGCRAAREMAESAAAAFDQEWKRFKDAKRQLEVVLQDSM